MSALGMVNAAVVAGAAPLDDEAQRLLRRYAWNAPDLICGALACGDYQTALEVALDYAPDFNRLLDEASLIGTRLRSDACARLRGWLGSVADFERLSDGTRLDPLRGLQRRLRGIA